MAISVKLEAFEGPLDLLLHLIEKNKVDIYDIPIVEITDQYMAYIQQMRTRDLNVMSEFLFMAATLLDIKCRMLLPKKTDAEGEEEDPRQELVEQLLQYKLYRYIAEELREKQTETMGNLFRERDLPAQVEAYEEPVNLDRLLQDVTVTQLTDVFRDVLRRQRNKIDPIHSKFGKIEKEVVPLAVKMHYVKDYARRHKRFSFRSLLEEQPGREHVIAAFLAILELMREGEILAEQDDVCGEIRIRSLCA